MNTNSFFAFILVISALIFIASMFEPAQTQETDTETDIGETGDTGDTDFHHDAPLASDVAPVPT